MESKCFSCKNKNVKTSYGYTTCNYSGSECRNFELYDPVKRTNADRIRSMSVEELAAFLYHTWNNASWCMVKDHCPDEDSCFPCWLEWLRKEHE